MTFRLFSYAVVMCLVAALPLFGQVGSNEQSYTDHISESLLRMQGESQRMPEGAFKQYLQEELFFVRESDGKVQVELIDRSRVGDVQGVAESLGLEVTGVWKNRASCFMDISKALDVARVVPEGYFLHATEVEPPNDQGPGLQNSQGYIDAGKDGSGIKIAIIDSGWDELIDAINQGDVPATFDSTDFTGNGFTSGTNEHGTGCFEVAYDNAPGAQYFLYRTSGGTQFGQAVDDAIDNDVDILSTSLGPHNTGWDDNTGPYCEAVDDAVDAGMLVFVTAGNEAQKHWQGDFEDEDDDNWHEWTTGE